MVKIFKHGGKKTKVIVIAVVVIIVVLASFFFVNGKKKAAMAKNAGNQMTRTEAVKKQTLMRPSDTALRSRPVICRNDRRLLP